MHLRQKLVVFTQVFSCVRIWYNESRFIKYARKRKKTFHRPSSKRSSFHSKNPFNNGIPSNGEKKIDSSLVWTIGKFAQPMPEITQSGQSNWRR